MGTFGSDPIDGLWFLILYKYKNYNQRSDHYQWYTTGGQLLEFCLKCGYLLAELTEIHSLFEVVYSVHLVTLPWHNVYKRYYL